MYVRESSADYWAEWVYHGGAFELAFMLERTVKWKRPGTSSARFTSGIGVTSLRF